MVIRSDQSIPVVPNLFINVAHFYFENIPMALYRKFLRTFKRTPKEKGHRVEFRDFLPFFKQSQKVIVSESAIFCYLSDDLRWKKVIASKCASFCADKTFLNQIANFSNSSVAHRKMLYGSPKID